jgi:septum formation protein
MRYSAAMKRKVILASTSRWRREIFSYANIEFDVVESHYEEDMTVPLPPLRLVRQFALGKALSVATRHPKAVVIGADTVLLFRGKALGKPKTKKEAVAMLKRWSGKRGVALTAFALVLHAEKRRVVRTIQTAIFMRKLSSAEIAAYVETGEAFTGAGAFTIMGKAASFIHRIEGDFYNIVGLPLAALVQELKKFGVGH